MVVDPVGDPRPVVAPPHVVFALRTREAVYQWHDPCGLVPPGRRRARRDVRGHADQRRRAGRRCDASITNVERESGSPVSPLAPRGCVCFRGRSDNEPSDEYDVVCTYITVINLMSVWPTGQDPTPPARGQQQQLSLHLEHEFLHSHDGHAQEVHPHDLHVVASGHAQLSGPQASQSFGQHAIVAGRSEVRRGMAKRGCPRSVGRTSAVGRTRGSLAPRGLCV